MKDNLIIIYEYVIYYKLLNWCTCYLLDIPFFCGCCIFLYIFLSCLMFTYQFNYTPYLFDYCNTKCLVLRVTRPRPSRCHDILFYSIILYRWKIIQNVGIWLYNNLVIRIKFIFSNGNVQNLGCDTNSRLIFINFL